MTETTIPEEAANTAQENQPVRFAMQKIFVKDLSLEIPGAPEVFKLEYKPEIKLELNSRSRQTAPNEYEVEVTMSVTATQDETTLFVVEVQQVGIFEIHGITDNMKMRHALSAYCPNILFPYMRETISNLVTRGGFPPLLVAPVNFDQLFTAQLQKEQQDQAAQQSPEIVTNETEQ